jgi:hypothetical protein
MFARKIRSRSRPAAFSTRSGTLQTNQTILLKGDRIFDVGAAVRIRPAHA